MTFDDDLASEMVLLARDVNTGQPTEVALIDPTMPEDHPPQIINADLARAVARRLVTLADEIEPPRTLRRPATVDEALRDREGGR